VDYAYDTAGRLETVSEGPYENRSFVYTYRPDSSLVSTLTSKLDGSAWFRENRYQDNRGRLIGIRSARVSGSSVVAKISSHAYDYDALGRRVKNTFQDGSRWEYGYNDRSEVTSAVRKDAAGNSIPQLGASYGYDGIGNRLSSSSPVLGDHGYTPNSLNQYETITTGTSRTAIGRADSSWNVLVNDTAADRNGDIYFRALTTSNTSAPVWQEVITKRDTGTPTSTGHLWYAAASVTPAYDFDGNLRNDGRWIYSWDAENRLIQMETTTAATDVGHPYVKVRYTYDWQGRRLARTVYKGTAASPVFSESQRWLYDAWNPVIEFTATAETGGTLIRRNTYSWGLDLSGTLQGAGGVGGLLGVARLTINPVTYLATTDHYASSFDGNGNIVAWTKRTDSAPTSRREYDAFGNAVVTEGTAPCGFGFSTKIQDAETGLYYYGLRWYDAPNGRWISKDPIEEEGGVNLYGFVSNDGVGRVDVLGMLGIDLLEKQILEACKNSKGTATNHLKMMLKTWDEKSDKYIITRNHGVVDAHHFINGVNVMFRNRGMTADVYVNGGEFTLDNGKKEKRVGTLASTNNGIRSTVRRVILGVDVEDPSSDMLGSKLGELLRMNDEYVDSAGKMKDCRCENLAKKLVEILKSKGALTAIEQDKLFNHYRINGKHWEGGKTGYFVREWLTGGNNDIALPNAEPYRAKFINDIIWKAGL
jgi:RHS repeat-associated protein